MEPTTVSIYERHASTWARRRGDAADDLAEHFREELGAGRILDAGCGPARYLPDLGSPAVGLDATAAMLEIARVRVSQPLVRGDLEVLPFCDASFRGLFARNAYLHVPKERFVAAAVEARRVLAPGGRLLMTMLPGEGEGDLPGDDLPGRWFSLWRASELCYALLRAGFEEVQISTAVVRSVDVLVATARARGARHDVVPAASETTPPCPGN